MAEYDILKDCHLGEHQDGELGRRYQIEKDNEPD